VQLKGFYQNNIQGTIKSTEATISMSKPQGTTSSVQFSFKYFISLSLMYKNTYDL
jgi:hypothetical protein